MTGREAAAPQLRDTRRVTREHQEAASGKRLRGGGGVGAPRKPASSSAKHDPSPVGTHDPDLTLVQKNYILLFSQTRRAPEGWAAGGKVRRTRRRSPPHSFCQACPESRLAFRWPPRAHCHRTCSGGWRSGARGGEGVTLPSPERAPLSHVRPAAPRSPAAPSAPRSRAAPPRLRHSRFWTLRAPQNGVWGRAGRGRNDGHEGDGELDRLPLVTKPLEGHS